MNLRIPNIVGDFMLVYWIVKFILSLSFFDSLQNVSNDLFSALSIAVSYINSFSLIFDFALFVKLFLVFISVFFAAMILKVVLHFVKG